MVSPRLAAGGEKQRFVCRETELESVEWQVELEINGPNVEGKITAYGLKPTDYPKNTNWIIDSELPPEVCRFTGKIAAGSNERQKKLGLKLEGEAPLWIANNKVVANWLWTTN